MKHRIALVLAVALGLPGLAAAAEAAGTIKTLKGNAHIERGGERIPARIGAEVLASDRLVTAPDAALGVTLKDNTLLSAGPNSILDLNKFAFDTTTHAGTVDASLRRGTLAVISGKIAKANPDAVRFSSPSVSLGVRGTEFILEAGDGGL